MSDNSKPHATPGEYEAQGAHEAHTGPITNPKQLLVAVFFSFVVPVFAIIGLVYFVVSNFMPAGSTDKAAMELGGMSAESHTQAIANRIQKVGTVEVRDANRPMKAGEEVYKAVCVACHATGVNGAPKLGDEAAWAPRIKQGYDTLLNSALKGKGSMPPQGGGDFADMEIANAVVYLANGSGGKFEAPKAAAPVAATAAAPAVDPALAIAMQQVAAAKAGTAVPAAAAPAAAGAGAGVGQALYGQACQVCHAAGVAGAPKFGDKAAWAPRIQTGLETLVASVIKGKGAMPPKGGAAAASDADIRSAVEYMVNAAK